MAYDYDNAPLEQESFRLTTEDNPYNPFTQFVAWYLYDLSKGYNTCGMLAKLIELNSKGLRVYSEAEENAIEDKSMNELIQMFPYYNYVKVQRPKTN